MKQLKISKELSLPLDIVTQTVAILAKRRVGKSYTMRGIAEQLLDCGQQVVLVDPKGDQWGIRSSADGKKPGYPIVILGGEHGDAPLEVNSGEIVAKLVVEERVSVLIDLSTFRKHEIATFMAIFLENLYRLKAQEKYRTPVMLIIDEADAIAPQKPQKGEERMLGAAEDIVRRGGQRGIGCILVTQRSAVLNKNVLTQAQILIVLRTIAPQDLSAMNAWIDVHGTPEQRKILMDSLPSLPVGDAWFWSPGYPTAEGIFKLVHVSPIKTFDSAATPKPGETKITPKNLADVDMEALKKQMAATIEKAKQEDPKELKKKILELEKRLSNIKKEKNIEIDIDKILKPHLLNFTKEEKKLRDEALARYRVMKEIQKMISPFLEGLPPIKNNSTPIKEHFVKPLSPVKSDVYRRDFRQIPEFSSDKPLSKGAKSVLSYLHSVNPEGRTKTQMWVATGYSPGGGFNNLIYELTGKELIMTDGRVYKFLQKGEDSNIQEFNPSLDLWKNKLSVGARKIFELMLNDPYTPFGKEYLAQQTGYAMGGGFNNLIYELTGAELIKKQGIDYIINEEILNL